LLSAAGPAGPPQPSAELLTAQEQLLRLRRQQREARRAAGLELRTDEDGRRLDASVAETYEVSKDLVGLKDAPVGFESTPFTTHIRAALDRRAAALDRRAATLQHPAEPQTGQLSEKLSPRIPETSSFRDSRTIALSPDLALAILRAELTAPGRLWLLLRLLDNSGQGWLYLQDALQQLTTPQAPLRFCAARQLRSLIAQGEPLFWERRADPGSGKVRVWLRSPAKVARALGCARLSGQPVMLPVRCLLGGIGQVRAHFYAAFHSAREAMANDELRMTHEGDSSLVTRHSSLASAAPISRETLRRLSAVSPSSQRAYERRAGVVSTPNWALGPRKGAGDDARRTEEHLAWRHGRALFTFVDKAGKHGAAGGQYLAWRLPNSYTGPHARPARKRRRHTIQQPTDLAQLGTPGNGERQRRDTRPERVFCADGRGAAAGAMTGQARYWPGPPTGRGRRRYWYVMGGDE